MGDFGLPKDAFAWGSLALAFVWWFVAQHRHRTRFREAIERHYRFTLAALGIAAALTSVAYFEYYLRGGSRIIDATAYYQQAKIFASGAWTSGAFEPSAATRGRFVYYDPTRASVAILFPPGYPALLSLGIRIGIPKLVGACLAALLVWVTAALARRVFERKDVALLAALLSATTMALRYHTADTMAHGLTALLVASAVLGSLRVSWVGGATAGFSLGWLVATRPVTGAVMGLVCLLYRGFGTGALARLTHALRNRSEPAAPERRGMRCVPTNAPSARSSFWFLACAAGLTPGLLLWLGYQWASTGSLWSATQYAYYAVADGPPGCFRYGFGKGIGCLFEHGEFVAKRLPNGYGILEASYVTLLRLRWHSLDVNNCEPLVVALLLALVKGFRASRTRLLAIAIVAVLLGYLPFYFDASYPGGGARLFADVIPLEHVLVAGWLVTTEWRKVRHAGQRWTHTVLGWTRWFAPKWFFPWSMLGFALHGTFEHQKLRNRDGGRPMFEPQVLAAAGIRQGLVFVDTDHGFFLGHDPAQRDPSRGLVVVRRHGDAHDRAAWEALGRPAAHVYRYDPRGSNALPSVEVLQGAELASRLRFEAEAEWPAWTVRSGWVRPVFPPNDCTSGRRGLALEPIDGRASITVPYHAHEAGLFDIEFGFVAKQSGLQRVRITVGGLDRLVERAALEHQCFTARFDAVALSKGEQPMNVETNALGLVLDYWRPISKR